MRGQIALTVNLVDASHREIDLGSAAHYVGPLDICLDPALLGQELGAAAVPLFVLGVGPLAGTPIPGVNHLTVATVSPLSRQPYVTTLAGLGVAFDGLGVGPLALAGRAKRPSVLTVERQGGSVRVSVEALDPVAVWRRGRRGALGLIDDLGQRHGNHPAAVALVVGPAAQATSFGALVAAGWPHAANAPLVRSSTNGGLGSALWQRHGLCGIVIACERSRAELLERESIVSRLPPHQRPDRTLGDLEGGTGYRFATPLVSAGPAVARLAASGPNALSFNATSIYWSDQQRSDFVHQAVRGHLLAAIQGSLQDEGGGARDCETPCPVGCQRVSRKTLRSYEPHAFLGPQLGVLHLEALDELIEHALTLGYDVATLGVALGWLLERLAIGELSPEQLGLSASPVWSPDGFDPDASSRHNAQLALALMEGLLSERWAEALRAGMRSALHGAGQRASQCALVLAIGDAGEAAVDPFWSIGPLAPLPLPGEQYGYQAVHFVPPRELGQRCAERLVARLALMNYGVCEHHRGWIETAYPELLGVFYQDEGHWAEHHRDLARRLFRGASVPFWPRGRILDWVERRLLQQQHEGPADTRLDAWVRRFWRGQSGAARAFWSELLSGLQRGLST